MAAEFFERLLKRLDSGLTLLEPNASGSVSRSHLADIAENKSVPYGPYHLLRRPTVPQLWGSFHSALKEQSPLVILPPSSPEEEAVLLRQLSATPTPGACLVVFTSGSTSTPKAVFHSESSLLASADQLSAALPHSRTACLLPAWGMAGIAFHLLHLLHSGRQHLFSREPLLYWSGQLDSILRETKSELLTLNPFLLEMWVREFPLQWKGETISLTSPLSAAARKNFAKNSGGLSEIYGMSEAAGPVLLNGKSLGIKTRIAAGESELELNGDQLFLGYASEGEFSPRSEWFSTGDQFLSEGEKLKFSARLKELINLGGRKVAPALIEEIFEMPELSGCIAFEKMILGESRVGLVYVRSAACELSREELARRIEQRARTSLSLDMRPGWWGEIEEISRLPSGKADRKKIRSERS